MSYAPGAPLTVGRDSPVTPNKKGATMPTENDTRAPSSATPTQAHVDRASELIMAKAATYECMGWNRAQVIFMAATSCLAEALARREVDPS